MRNSARTFVSRRELIRNGLLVASGCACAPGAFSQALNGQANPAIADASQTWTIGNELIKRTIAFHPNAGLFTKQFSNLSTHADFTAPGKMRMGQEFSLLCNGHSCAGANAVFEILGAHQAGRKQRSF